MWTVCASDEERVEFHNLSKTQDIVKLEKALDMLKKGVKENESHMKLIEQKLHLAIRARTFRLKPQTFSCRIKVSPNDLVKEKQPMNCMMTQIPINSSDAITGHKLQGLTKDHIIVYSWNKSTSWIYVVLSRVRKLSGLYLVRSLKLSDIKPPSRDYLLFMQRMEKVQDSELTRHTHIFSEGEFV